MNRKWRILYYIAENGYCPVQEFIDSRSDRDQAKTFSWLAQLEIDGPSLPRPYADLSDSGIHELRLTLSGDQVRILYFFCFRDFIVLTHAFVKRTRRLPVTEIHLARKYREDFLSRFDEGSLRSCLKVPGAFPSASERVSVQTGEFAPI